MSDNNNVVELLTPSERDQQILQLRLAGASVGDIARRYKIGEKHILRVLDKQLPTLTPATRARYLREAIGQLDQLQSWWASQARNSLGAAHLLIKVNERRSALLGLDAAQHTRMDPVTIVEGGQPDESSTQALLRELNRIAAERPPEVIIETEAERDAGIKAPETPDADPTAA